VDWLDLSGNPGAVPLLAKHLDKVYWPSLSSNPNAIPILNANPDKVSWWDISSNPNAFGYDYDAMKASRALLAEDLTNVFFHPDNIGQFRGLGLELSERWGI